MNNEVSSMMGRTILQIAAAAGVPATGLVEGLPFDERTIARRRRMQWDDLCELMERLERAVGGPETLDTLIAEQYARSFPRPMQRIARSFVSPKLLLRFVFKTLDPVLFPNTDFEYHELPDGRVRVACKLHAYARPSLTFMRGTIPALHAVPTHLGLPPAEVEVEELSPTVVAAVVTLPESDTLFARTRRRGARASADLLALFSEVSHDSRTYSDAARKSADRLAQVAALGRDLARCEDLPALGQSILAMLASAGWTHVALYAGDELVASRPGPATRVLPLELGGRAIGRLEVGGAGDGELLADLLPWLAIAVDKARSAPAAARTSSERLARLRERLTAKQLEVLEHVVAGRSNKEIAAELECAENTVEYHVTQLLRKFGVDTRLQLIAQFWAE